MAQRSLFLELIVLVFQVHKLDSLTSFPATAGRRFQ